MKRILTFSIILVLASQLQAQSWVKLKSTKEVQLFYKIKTDKDGEEEMRVKLINKSKSHLNVDVEIGFYDTGVLDQRSNINRCLKKGFHNNLFRMWQVIQLEEMNSTTKFSDYKIEVLELKTNKVDKCEVMEP